MASIGDVAAALRTALTTVEEAARIAMGADDQLDNALTSLQADLADSSNSLAHDGLGQLRTAREGLAEALALIARGTDRMGEYIASIAGGASRSGGEGTPPPPPRSKGGPAPHHKHYDPTKAEPITPYLRRRKTVGVLYIGGKRVGELLWSGESGPAADTEGVKPQWALKSSVRTHTEGHAAAVMRSGRMAEAEVYINRAVCDVDPDCCIQRIPEVLRHGYTLRVFDVTRPEARPIILKGTGEGLIHGNQ